MCQCYKSFMKKVIWKMLNVRIMKDSDYILANALGRKLPSENSLMDGVV